MIKIAFADWWQCFNTADNFITRALDGKADESKSRGTALCADVPVNVK